MKYDYCTWQVWLQSYLDLAPVCIIRYTLTDFKVGTDLNMWYAMLRYDFMGGS